MDDHNLTLSDRKAVPVGTPTGTHLEEEGSRYGESAGIVRPGKKISPLPDPSPSPLYGFFS